MQEARDVIETKRLNNLSLESRVQSFVGNDSVLNSKIEELEKCKSIQAGKISSLQSDLSEKGFTEAALFGKGYYFKSNF